MSAVNILYVIYFRNAHNDINLSLMSLNEERDARIVTELDITNPTITHVTSLEAPSPGPIPPPQPPLIPSSQLPLPDLPVQPRPLHVPDNEGYEDVYQFINDDPDPTYKDLTQTSSTSSDVYAVSSHRDSEHGSSCKSSQSSESPKPPEQVVIKDQYFTMPPPCQKTHEYGNAEGTFVGPSSMA